ncbi:hypothetical protein TrLO_g8401 [Triparma laevis f. longispina]|uniref:Uncharacterized protein n=1 Tax=Triparma laevis f. longispina TaxID=1714387 RepID=A0A9W7AUK1_9STRA|nr:hypothetical protein TrLO_g8401 [Triparma laevis f. longispina]
MALSILLRRSFVRSSVRSSLHSSSLPSPLPSSILSVRTFSTPGGAIQDKPSDNTKLFVRALDSDIRGEVDPRDLDLINDQDVMGPLSKKWSSLQSYINNIREHDLTSKSHLKQQSYTALPEVFKESALKEFVDPLPINRAIASHVQPIPGFEAGDEKSKEGDEVAEKYFFKEGGGWREKFGEVL